jgi:probable HAF family extracellular repeat protein
VDFPGSTFNQLLGINDYDQAAGYLQDSQGNFHPYIWDANGGIFLRLFIPQAVSAQATGINDGQAVSGFFIDAKGVNHGFLLANGTFVKLDFPHATFTQALGLNDYNEVVGTYTDAGGNTHGFSWQNGKFHSIDDPAGFGSTVVNGVNDHGRIVGFYGNTASGISNGFVGTPSNQ